MHCRAYQTESERSVGSVGGNVQLFQVQSGAPLHEVYIEGGSSRCIVEGSSLTTFLSARSHVITKL